MKQRSVQLLSNLRELTFECSLRFGALYMAQQWGCLDLKLVSATLKIERNEMSSQMNLTMILFPKVKKLQ